jgi:hypothetical protein
MSHAHFATYTGSRAAPFGPAGGYGAGTCRKCGCASGDCCCGCRTCRTEAKEITATGAAQGRDPIGVGGLAGAHLAAAADVKGAAAAPGPVPVTAFVGGGCCVHISLEYAPIVATTQSAVAILVKDTEGTVMAWEKLDPPGGHYTVKENVVTTKPGATITLVALNATVRARWCEVFSC